MKKEEVVVVRRVEGRVGWDRGEKNGPFIFFRGGREGQGRDRGGTGEGQGRDRGRVGVSSGGGEEFIVPSEWIESLIEKYPYCPL